MVEMLHALRFVALVFFVQICSVSAFVHLAAPRLPCTTRSTRTCTTMGLTDVVAGVASGVSRGLVGAKDALYDAYDAIDDRLSQQQKDPPAPILPVDSRKQKVVRSGSNPLSAVAAAAATVKDTVYAGVEVVTEAPALAAKVQTRSEYQRSLAAAQQADKRLARLAQEDKTAAFKDRLWDTYDTLNSVAAAVVATPAKVSSAVTTVQQLPGQVKANADSAVAAVNKSTDSIKSAAAAAQQRSQDFADLVTGKRAAKLAAEKARLEQEAAAAREKRARYEAQTPAAVLKPVLSSAVTVTRQAVGVTGTVAKVTGRVTKVLASAVSTAASVPPAVLRAVLEPVQGYQQSQDRIEAAKAAEAAAPPAPELVATVVTAVSSDDSSSAELLVPEPLQQLARAVLTPAQQYKQAQERIEAAKAREASSSSSVQPVIKAPEQAKQLTRAVLGPALRYKRSQERIEAAKQAAEQAAAAARAQAAAEEAEQLAVQAQQKIDDGVATAAAATAAPPASSTSTSVSTSGASEAAASSASRSGDVSSANSSATTAAASAGSKGLSEDVSSVNSSATIAAASAAPAVAVAATSSEGVQQDVSSANSSASTAAASTSSANCN
jgi:hypothetical protein